MILVDDLRRYGPKRWAHMVSDTSLDELHNSALLIGLRRAWFQGDHYDVQERVHARALRSGAALVRRRELVQRRVRVATLL